MLTAGSLMSQVLVLRTGKLLAGNFLERFAPTFAVQTRACGSVLLKPGKAEITRSAAGPRLMAPTKRVAPPRPAISPGERHRDEEVTVWVPQSMFDAQPAAADH
jgi:hypothetical protein